jgi:multidrug efflux system membrane fusion protein
MRAVYSYGIAGLIILIAAAWLATGTLVIGGRGPGNGEQQIVSLIEDDGGPITQSLKDSGLLAHPHHSESVDPHLTIAQRISETSGAEAPAQSVRTVTYKVQAMPIEVELRGRTEAKASVSVVPETQGRVDVVHVAKGQSVAAGDLLCTLDQGTRQAAVAQAEAAVAQARSEFEANAALREKELAPANSGLPLEAALRAAEANLMNAEAELERTEVRAPVRGVVQDPMATVGEMLGAGAPCATVVQLDPMLFAGAVPEARIGYAKLGLPATITTVTGTTVEGKVSFIASSADPATRTFAVEIQFDNAELGVRDGITATATVEVGTAPAHLLPQSVLTLDNEGELGVRAVNGDNEVQFYPVTILQDTRDGVHVAGLPPTVDIITVGQEFVQAGQRVNPTNVTAESPTATDVPAEGVAS